MGLYFKRRVQLSIIAEIALIMLLSSLLSSLINILLIIVFNLPDSLGKLATMMGYFWIFSKTYVPIGVLPDFAQIIMKITYNILLLFIDKF